jgi:FkbM family methyltransferase
MLRWFKSRLLGEVRERLINIEVKQDGHADESRVRLANIETIVERIANNGGNQKTGDAFANFGGSPDQGFGHLTYSQFGEDLMVANVFALLEISQPTYLDVGANHPIAGSNTALFYARGNRGVIVEANPHLMPIWREIRPSDLALNLGVAPERGELPFLFIDDFSGRNTFHQEYADALTRQDQRFNVQSTKMIQTVPINDIVAEHLDGRWPDFLTLDIEGMDYAVLESARFDGSGPKVICVEVRNGAGDDISEPFLKLLPEKGYTSVFRTWSNLIAVRQDAVQALHLRSV